MTQLGDRIATAVLSTFNGLPPKGKPTVRSNGKREWTVLAAIVAIVDVRDSDSKAGEPVDVVPICLATGVKTLPEKFREYSAGLLVHDLHAEILAFRLLNWYLLAEVEKLAAAAAASDETIDQEVLLIEKRNAGGYKLKNSVRLALFITEPPCGDASMSHMVNDLEDKSAWTQREPHADSRSESRPSPPSEDSLPRSKRQKVEVELVRGRHYIGQLGIVRTKPGRKDSPLSLSKSCSDKICLKQLTGLTSSITAQLFPENIFLEYLVLDAKQYHPEDFERCFRQRFNKELLRAASESSDSTAAAAAATPHHVQVLTYTSTEAFEYSKHDEGTTSPLSLLYVSPTNTRQVLNNGVRDGSHIKNKPPRKGGESLISNRQLFSKAKPFVETAAATYSAFKQEQAQRTAIKNLGRQVLGQWEPTGIDDFSI